MKKKIATAILIAASAQLASADGLKSLESFMKDSQTGRADFSQVVTSPPKDGQVARTKTSSGTFEFQRPGRFRFVYKKPFEQTIVADGQTLWLYDADLNQVTQRAQAQALGSTPAALLASAPDLSALRADFTLEAAPRACAWALRASNWPRSTFWTALASARPSALPACRTMPRCQPPLSSSSRRKARMW